MAPYTIVIADRYGAYSRSKYATWTEAMQEWARVAGLRGSAAVIYGADADDCGRDLTEDEEAQL